MTAAVTSDESEIDLPQRRSNRPITLQHRFEFSLAVIALGFFRVIGLDASSALAGGFMRMAGPFIRPVSKRAEINLASVFPDWPEKKIKKITADVWENLGRTAAEFAHLEKFCSFEEGGRIVVEGEERLKKIAAGESPVIFVSGHFANWEVGSIALHRAGVEYGVVYRPANNPLIDELIIKKRGAVMSRHQIPKNKRSSRALIECLKSGRSIAMLTDQKLNHGIEAAFLGRKAMTAPAPARLALKFKAPIIPVSIERRRGAHFHVVFNEPINFTPTGDMEADILALTNEINKTIEKDIRARPGQWLWLHRRWTKKRKS